GTASCRAAATVSGGGFVKGVVSYMVKDSLEATPMSTISCITLLNKFNVKDLGSVKERVVDFSLDEVRLLCFAVANITSCILFVVIFFCFIRLMIGVLHILKHACLRFY
ncbi:DUF674 family protein, partial [Melia azedarach]